METPAAEITVTVTLVMEMRGETIVMERIRIPGRIPVRDRKKRREKERCRAA